MMIDDLVKICREEGVEIKLNTPATVEAIKELSPCAVIAATGSRPIKPRFAGNCPAEDILTLKIFSAAESSSGTAMLPSSARVLRGSRPLTHFAKTGAR